MNESVESEKFIREQVQKLLLEFDVNAGWISDQYGAGPRLGVWSALFEPFIDVFKVATIAAKDITSAALDIADYAITFDREKQDAIRERFRQRREKYKGKMAKAMQSTEEVFLQIHGITLQQLEAATPCICSWMECCMVAVDNQ